MPPTAAVIAVLAIALQSAPGTRPPPPLPKGTSRISGRVLDAATAQPMPGARVTLNRLKLTGGRIVETDAAGRYVFDAIPAGDYLIRASADGYATAANVAQSGAFFGAPVTVEPGGALDGVDLRLGRAATISGRVIDAAGEPLARSRVSVSMQSGSATVSGFVNAETNAAGEYVLDGLPPGVYYVYAMPPVVPAPNGKSVATPFEQTFYPGVEKTAAATLSVSPGDRVRDVNITLIEKLRLAIVGTVAATVPVTEIETGVGTPKLRRSSPVRADGSFVIEDLPPGRYVVWAKAQSEQGPLAAWQAIDLAGEPRPMQLTLGSTGRLQGRLVTENGTPVYVSGVHVGAALTDEGQDVDPLLGDAVEVQPDGRFSLTGLFGTRMLRVYGFPAGAELIAIRSGGRTLDPAIVSFDNSAVVTVEIVVGPR